MVEHTDEFELEHISTMYDVKVKVNQWRNSHLGRDYVLSVKSENHIVLKKTKYRMGFCGCTLAFAIFGVMSLGGLYFPPGTTIEEILAVLNIYAVIILTGIVIGLTLFAAFPTRSEFSLTFHEGPPIRVTARVKGEVHEYGSLRKTLHYRETKQPADNQIGRLDF